MTRNVLVQYYFEATDAEIRRVERKYHLGEGELRDDFTVSYTLNCARHVLGQIRREPSVAGARLEEHKMALV